MANLKKMNPPSHSHQEFLSDSGLSLEQVGALALMLKSEGPFTGDWLYRARPHGRPGSVGRTRSQRIVRELKALGYADARSIRDTDKRTTTIRTSIRGSLDLPFSQAGPLIQLLGLPEVAEVTLAKSTATELSKGTKLPAVRLTQGVASQSREFSVEIVVQPEVLEAEMMDEVVVIPKKSRKVSIATQAKEIRQDPRWLAVLTAYREMLKGIGKIGNLGDLSYAAKAFLELVPNLDADPTLLTDILASLPRYQLACNGYPVRLQRYLREGVWKDHPPEKETDWSDL